jgi:hypothetical protein
MITVISSPLTINQLYKLTTGPITGALIAGCVATRINPTATLGSLRTPALYAALGATGLVFLPEAYSATKYVVKESMKWVASKTGKAIGDVVKGVQEFIKKNPIKTVVTVGILSTGFGCIYGDNMIDSGKRILETYGPKELSDFLSPEATPLEFIGPTLPEFKGSN